MPDAKSATYSAEPASGQAQSKYLRTRSRLRVLPRRKHVLGIVGLVVLSVGIAGGVFKGEWFVIFALIVVSAFFLAGIQNWRWSVYGLLFYLPVSGVAIVLSASTTNLAVLIKDVLFVVPAYVGFALLARRKGWRAPGVPVVAVGVLASLVVLESLNPILPNRLVGLIGMKVWLFYIPLLFLGYHFVRSREELRAVLGLMTALAMLPAVIGIIEAIAIYSGHANQVYSFYGSAAPAVTQQFGQWNYVGGGFSRRIPSTFSFGAQYFAFLASMIAVAYAWWRISGRRLLGAGACTILVAAAFTSGARAAFIMIPFLILLIVVFDRRLGQGSTVLMVGSVALFGAATLFGTDVATVFNTAVNIGVSETQGTFIPDTVAAITTGALGHGTGYSTLSARFALVGQIDDRIVVETWYGKVILELGFAGLLTVLALFAQLLHRAYKAHRRLFDSGLRAFSSAVVAFLIWNLIYMIKGGWIDIDPVNVYFWLFAGMALRLPALELGPLAARGAGATGTSPFSRVAVG